MLLERGRNASDLRAGRLDIGQSDAAVYTANASINDRRIKALGTVSAVNIGSMFRNGRDNNIKDAHATPASDNGSKARTAEANGTEIQKMPFQPLQWATRQAERVIHRRPRRSVLNFDR
jgi:hypothetical protein